MSVMAGPRTDGRAIAAALDIGSNTVHLLVGRLNGGAVEPLDDAAELVGLGEDVYAADSDGRISPARLDRAAETVVRLAARARQQGAETVLLVATAAVRDAANADELAAAVRERGGLDLAIISGEREAALTYRGAVAGQDPRAVRDAVQVCDVGGGSTEVIRAEAGRIVLETSLQLGSSRLSRPYTSDPPGRDELARTRDTVTRTLAALPPYQPALLAVTGGTAAALIRVAGSAERRYTMGADELQRVADLVYGQSAAEIAAHHEVDAGRARLLPAGVTIVDAIREGAGAGELVLTEAGLRDGLLLEYLERRA